MDWFHCNQCFTRRGSKFAVSSCGHICCEACIKSKQCSVCGASCSYLPITDEMKPQEKVFFKDPVNLIQSRLEHISQVAQFQWIQMERATAHFKHKSVELERRLKEVTEQGYRQVSELKRENADLKKQLSELRRETADLKKPLSQRRVSPGRFHGTQRMTLPVAVTSPVTHRSRTISYLGSAESQGWTRDRGPSLSSFTTPGSATSISSHSSLHEHVHRTPTSYSTPTSNLSSSSSSIGSDKASVRSPTCINEPWPPRIPGFPSLDHFWSPVQTGNIPQRAAVLEML